MLSYSMFFPFTSVLDVSIWTESWLLPFFQPVQQPVSFAPFQRMSETFDPMGEDRVIALIWTLTFLYRVRRKISWTVCVLSTVYQDSVLDLSVTGVSSLLNSSEPESEVYLKARTHMRTQTQERFYQITSRDIGVSGHVLVFTSL